MQNDPNLAPQEQPHDAPVESKKIQEVYEELMTASAAATQEA